MTFNGSGGLTKMLRRGVLALSAFAALAMVPAHAADEPDLIFRRSTVFKWLSPNDKLATYGVDDPEVEGVACHFTVPEKGGFKGWLGLAEEVSDISLACRQIGPITLRPRAIRARICSGSAAAFSSRKCKSSAAATPSETCWFTWSIRTGSSRGRRRTRRHQFRSCPGGSQTLPSRNAATSSNKRSIGR